MNDCILLVYFEQQPPSRLRPFEGIRTQSKQGTTVSDEQLTITPEHNRHSCNTRATITFIHRVHFFTQPRSHKSRRRPRPRDSMRLSERVSVCVYACPYAPAFVAEKKSACAPIQQRPKPRQMQTQIQIQMRAPFVVARSLLVGELRGNQADPERTQSRSDTQPDSETRDKPDQGQAS